MRLPRRSGSRAGRAVPLVALLAALALGAPLFTGAPAALAAGPSFALDERRLFGSVMDTQSVAYGDLDGDGDLDLVAGVLGQSATYLNDGRGSFGGDFGCNQQAAVRCFGPANGSVHAVALGDLDGDGDLDLVAGGALYNFQGLQGGTTVYHNNGSGDFTPVSSSRLPPATSLALGDLDNDGDLDLVAGGAIDDARFSPGATRVYRNIGGSFSEVTTLPTPAWSVALGDIDRDSDLDLLVGSAAPATALYLNQGGSLVEAPGRGLGPAKSLALGDLDGDGDLDVAAGLLYGQGTVYLQDGGVFAAGSLFGPAGDPLRSVALGDMNGDGALDIVAGSGYGQGLGDQNAVYLNRGGGGFASGPIDCSSAEMLCFGIGFDVTASVALGDVDGDGDLDIAAGNNGGDDSEQSAVYLNSGGGRFAAGFRPIGRANAPIRRLALGDLDDDGDLDIVAGNESTDNRIFFNDGTGSYPGDGQPFGRSGTSTLSVAVGDMDGDSDLDIVAGNDGEPSVVHFNDENGGFPSAIPFGAPVSLGRGTLGLALGDLDGDGDLDIVAGNYGGQSAVHFNDGTGRFPRAVPFGQSDDPTQAVGLGDLDGDGDLDLVVANNYGPNYIYHNDGQGGLTRGDAVGVRGGSISLGDLDGDGDLDVTIGSYLSSIFLNDGTGRFPTERPLNSGGKAALGDLDGDGDLDIIIYTFNQSLVYMNSGAATFAPSGARTFASPRQEIETVGVGDIDRDGDMDIVGGVRPFYFPNQQQQSGVFLNGQQGARVLQDNAPTVRVLRPGPTPEAPFFSSVAITDSAVIAIDYVLADPEGDPVRSIRAEYSLDGGGSWREARPDNATPRANLAAPPEGRRHRFGWDTFASGFFGQSDHVVFRIVAVPDTTPRANRAASPFQRPYAAASSYPFRARGTQVRVIDGGGAPVQGAVVYRLAEGQTTGGAPLGPTGGAPFVSDSRGFLQGRGAVALGERLVALAPISATDTFTLYHTSAAPGPEGLAITPLTAAGVQTLAVSPDYPLVLFNLDVSLEWDARADPQYRARLEEDLRRTSASLYDLTDGQAALGEITVYHDKTRWNEAHLRIYATNRLRPNANQGGIVTEPISETVTIAGAARTITYEPGQIRMGAVWNRYGEPSGTLGDDWPRTLAHELGHFALFLDDNYLGFDASGRLISVGGCPGVMADPYIDNGSELRPTAGWLPGCERTLSNQLTGRSDWATVERFYSFPALNFRLRGPSAFNQNPGPGVQPLALTRVRFMAPDSPPTDRSPVAAPAIYLTDAQGVALQPDPQARAMLFQPDRGRLVDLGTIVLDRAELRGARVGDRLCVFEQGRSRLGCETLGAADQQLVLGEASGWRPDLVITPVTSRTVEVAVRNVEPGLPVYAQIYPGDYAATAPQRLAEGPGGYGGSFNFAEPALSGYLHLWIDEAQSAARPRREAVTDFSLGGSPGSNKNRTGLRNNPGSNKNRTAPVLSGDGQAILFTAGDVLPEGVFFTLQSLPAGEPPAWTTPVGQAYRLTASAGSEGLLDGSSINIGYLTSEVPPGTEQGISVFFRPPGGGAWQRLATSLDAERNEASAATRGPGQYALMTRLEARPGWNLLAYPWPEAPGVVEALARINAHGYTTVYGYADDDPADPWKVYDTGAPDWVNDLARLRYGEGYWVRLETAPEVQAAPAEGAALAAPAEDAALAETLPTPPATFYAFVDNPGARPLPAGTEVAALVNGVRCATTRIFAGATTGERTAFVIDVPADDGRALAGCGAPGRVVTFEAGGQALPQRAIWQNGRPQSLGAGMGGSGTTVYLPLVRR